MGEGLELSLREVLGASAGSACLGGRRHPLAVRVALAVCAIPGGGRRRR